MFHSLKCMLFYIIFGGSVMFCRASFKSTDGSHALSLSDDLEVSDHALLRSSQPRRILSYAKYLEAPPSDVQLDREAQEAETYPDSREPIKSSLFVKTPKPSFKSYVKFEINKLLKDGLPFSSGYEIRNVPPADAISSQERHLRYLMSSTAEQPDNSGRTSNFNVWLTVLIAALAAAILS